MNARFYNPSTGRFISQDSYSGNPYDPWTQNLYTYCGNNPTNMVDPTGHYFLTCVIVGAIIGAVIGASVVGYQDYKDDGEVFNGSKTVGDYAKGAAVGTVIGAAAGATVGYVGAMATGTAVTAGLSSGGAAAFNAGYAGLTAMGSNLAHQTAEKGIENVNTTEASVAGGFAALGSLAISRVNKLVKVVGNSISKPRSASPSTNATQPHGNSKLSKKPQHGYEIYDLETGDVVKTGISGQKLNQNGTSPRANRQVNAFNKAAGRPQYGARVVTENMPDRITALDWERQNALRLFNEGHSLSKHVYPAPWKD